LIANWSHTYVCASTPPALRFVPPPTALYSLRWYSKCSWILQEIIFFN
jgi:hypothetical protein